MARFAHWALTFPALLLFFAGVGSAAAWGASTGDGAWEWQNPTPCGNWLESTCFVDPLNGWAAGNHGTIIRTKDGGVTWHGQTTYTKKSLFGIHFCDLSNGWAVGEEGTILHTTNGGATWRAQKSGVTSWLYGVHAETKDLAWAVGDGGTILYTNDGGKTWLPDFSGTTENLRDVCWSDPDNGWAVGENGTILYRTPPCEMWVRQTSEVSAPLDGVCFVDNKRGWAVGDADAQGPTILSTQDGGQKWVRQTATSGYRLKSVWFADSLNGWVVGDWETILHTTNGGETWEQSTCPITGAYLRSVSGPRADGVTPTQAWAVGWCGIWDKLGGGMAQEPNFLPCVIIHTTDGSNWGQQSFGFFWGFAAVDFADTQKGWAVGSCTVAWTKDGGAHWTSRHWLGMEMLEGVDFVDDLYGWVCGAAADAGLIWYTPDGGQNWYEQQSGTPYWLASICFVDRQHGWACGENGTIVHTEDGGANWLPQVSGTDKWLKSVHFVDAEYGWCVGQDPFVSYAGIILATTDGGNHWTQQTVQGLPNLPMLNSVWFADRFNGWAVGWNGCILHTADGGQTWKAEQHGADQAFFCVRSVGLSNVWVLSGDYVLATANGGHCWVRQELGNQDQMGAMSFPTAEDGWVVGGGILHTESGGFGTCRGMKALPDFRRVRTQNVVVTAVLGTDIYIQQPDRSSGILVRGIGDIDIGEGDVLATLTGTTGRTADDERCITLDSLTVAAPRAEALAPLGMCNRSLGGGDFCFDPSIPGPPPTGQRGVEQGFGVNNIGLLGRTWGKVIDVDPHEWPEWMIIDDNSEQVYTRVKVIIPRGLIAPDVDRFVVVTGPISCVVDPESGTLKRAIKVRRQEDIWVIR